MSNDKCSPAVVRRAAGVELSSQNTGAPCALLLATYNWWKSLQKRLILFQHNQVNLDGWDIISRSYYTSVSVY